MACVAPGLAQHEFAGCQAAQLEGSPVAAQLEGEEPGWTLAAGRGGGAPESWQRDGESVAFEAGGGGGWAFGG